MTLYTCITNSHMQVGCVSVIGNSEQIPPETPHAALMGSHRSISRANLVFGFKGSSIKVTSKSTPEFPIA